MAKSITIAFPRGGILPASITGKDPENVAPHVPVKVPEAYGLQLIADRFAVAATEVKEPAAKSKRETPAAGINDIAALGKSFGDAKKALAEATAETRPTLQAAHDEAQQALNEAKAAK